MKQQDLFIVDSFFAPEECRDMIAYFMQHQRNSKYWSTSYYVPFDKRDPYIESVIDDIERLAQQYSPGCKFHWGQVVHWPHWSLMGAHYDGANEETKFTCVINLNQNYTGGRTFFEDGTMVEPKTGQAIFFNGMAHRHGVTRLTEGERFTVAAWFR